MSEILIQLRNNLIPSVRTGWQRKSIGYDDHEKYLEGMLKNVVIGDYETGVKKSSSIIVYGAPGSGKSTFVESTIAKLSKADETFHNARAIVRLNGTLCPDFNSSIEEICYQLKFSNLGDEVEGSENILDDLTAAKNFDDRLEETMAFLRTSMETLNQSIIFILDKLELFAEQPNQRLLYNLFDLAANCTGCIPICIIGITTRVDVLELFEKRVKSRFSHRNINLVGRYEFEEYLQLAQRMLSTPSFNLNSTWNERISTLFKKLEVQRILQSLFDTDKSIRQLSLFLYNVCLVADQELTEAHFQRVAENHFRCDAHVKTALDLPLSELLVLLAIYKQVKHNCQQAWQVVNLYQIVSKIVLSFGLSKDDFFKAVTRLETLELIIPVSGVQRNVGGVNNVGEIYFKSEITIQQFEDIFKNYPQLPSSFQEFL